MKKKLNRRQFLGAVVTTAGVGSAALIFTRSRPATVVPLFESNEADATFNLVRSLSPTSQVALGKSGIKISMVGIGTGSIGWRHRSNQTQLGQSGFTELILPRLRRVARATERRAYLAGGVFSLSGREWGG